MECPDHSLRLGGDRLFYGLYLNELVYYLLEAHTLPEVFDAYARAIMAWRTARPRSCPAPLRVPAAAGPGLRGGLRICRGRRLPIDPTLLYGFERELGFVACERAPDPVPCSSAPTCWPSPRAF